MLFVYKNYNIQESFQFGLNLVKIHFSLIKKVKYGEAIYVVGNNQLFGNWKVCQGFRLNWAEGDQWSGFTLIQRKFYKQVQFRYVVSKWDNPSDEYCEWEPGHYNRKINLKYHRNSIICKNQWGFQKVSLFLIVEQISLKRQYYVIGNTSQLGLWKYKQKLKNIQINEFSSQNIAIRKDMNCFQSSVYFFTFMVERSIKNIHYYYVIQEDGQFRKERIPGRFIDLTSTQPKIHPSCRACIKKSTGIQIYQTCEFDKLYFSMITKEIFLGAFLRTKEDFQELKRMNINNVLSIQSPEDYDLHSLSPYYLKLLSQQYGIAFQSYSIKDNSKEDFVQKCYGAFLLLKKILSEDNAKVYVHCSAGMYRSPQIIVLYLILMQGYSLDEAIKIVRERHPYAKPNYNVLSEAIKQISKKIFIKS